MHCAKEETVFLPGLAPLLQPMLHAQVHSVGHILHGPQLKKQAEIQHRQNQQTERQRMITYVHTNILFLKYLWKNIAHIRNDTAFFSLRQFCISYPH